MESRKVPALIALAGILIAVVLFLVLKDDTADEDATLTDTPASEQTTTPAQEDEQPAEKPKPPPVPVVQIKNGEPVSGVQELEFEKGARAKLRVKADAADELHFHGYDLYVDVGPGKAGTLTFDADIDGLFPLESHTTGVMIAEISVVP